MTPIELDAWLRGEIAAFPCRTSLLMTDLATGETLHALEPEAQVVSASTIKVPILLCALEQVRRGERRLEEMLPVPPETILEDTTDDPAQMRRGIRIILNEARRLSTMVEELLEFSKMEDGRFTLHMEQVDLQAEFEDAIFTYRELFRQEGIELTYESGDEDLPPIPGDSERLKQVFCNVLDNAAKHGGAGKRIDTSISREGEFEVVRVRDYGPGIPEAELPFIKQKFYKGSSKARGSGIGLAVCDEIVGLHNGIFTIGNADGGGAVVTICLPVKE